jgi:UDP-glucose 4-epimerase
VENLSSLVTGGAGFIGSSIVEKLLGKGYKVTVVDNLSNSNGKLIANRDVEFIRGDISKPAIVKTLRNYSFNHIYNFGSPSTDRFFTSNGQAVCETIRGMFNVLEIARVTGADSIIYPSSGTVYGNLPAPQTESAKIMPKSMYACTKMFLENFSGTINFEGIALLGLRIFTGYGEREMSKSPDSRSVVSIFYKAISSNLQPVVYGDGQQRRDFVHSDDIANIAIVGAKKKLAGVLNVGSGYSTSFNELIDLLNRKLGKSIKPKYINSPITKIDETRADISKLSTKLEYKPLRIEEGIDLYLKRIKDIERLLS